MRLAGLRAREGAVHVQVEEPLERADDVVAHVSTSLFLSPTHEL